MRDRETVTREYLNRVLRPMGAETLPVDDFAPERAAFMVALRKFHAGIGKTDRAFLESLNLPSNITELYKQLDLYLINAEARVDV